MVWDLSDFSVGTLREVIDDHILESSGLITWLICFSSYKGEHFDLAHCFGYDTLIPTRKNLDVRGLMCPLLFVRLWWVESLNQLLVEWLMIVNIWNKVCTWFWISINHVWMTGGRLTSFEHVHLPKMASLWL